MAFIRGFAQFWYDFLVGDDWKIAATVVTALLVGAALVLADLLPDVLLTPLVGVLLAAGFVLAVRFDTRRR